MSETFPTQQASSDTESSAGDGSENEGDSLSIHPPFADDEDDEIVREQGCSR